MIENDLARIADALEKIAASMGNTATPTPLVDPNALSAAGAIDSTKKKPAAKKPAKVPTPPPAQTADVPTPPPSAPAAPATTAAAAAPLVETTSVMTAEELNAQLGKEFHRLGNSDVGIRAAIAEMGVAGVSDLPPEKYAELLAKVRAL